MDQMFVVYAVSAHKLTPEEKVRMFEMHKIKYDRPDYDFESFAKTMTAWNDFEYSVSCSFMGAFVNIEEAHAAVVENRVDFNECGLYNFAAIVPIPVGIMYAKTYVDKETIRLYQYDNGVYKSLVFNDSRLCRKILQELTGMYDGPNA